VVPQVREHPWRLVGYVLGEVTKGSVGNYVGGPRVLHDASATQANNEKKS